MGIAHRNQETGKIETNGSQVGAVLEWARWISQVILIPFMVFCFWWGASVQKFMWAGDRQTADMAMFQHEAMDEHWEERFKNLPPPFYVALVETRFSGLELQVADLKDQAKTDHEEVLDRLNHLEAALRELARGR